jgi:Flp pilus assembly protein TadG
MTLWRFSAAGRRRPVRPGAASRARRGAVVAECALILPLMALIMVGMFELGRAVMVKDVLSDAARKGCRRAVVPGMDNTKVTKDVTGVLQANNITTVNAKVVVLVNDQVADVSTAQAGDKVSVTVSVPFTDAGWTASLFLSKTTLASEAVAMMKQ